MFAGLALLLTYFVLAIPAALIGIPWTLISGDITFLYHWSMWIVRVGLRVAGIKVVVSGRGRLDAKQTYIFLSNHVSNLDPTVMLPLLPGRRTAVFIKRSLTKIPVLGYAMKLGDYIPVDRDGRVEGAKESMMAAAGVLDRGVNIASFVEGTRSRDGRLLPFKKGPFYLALETGRPVVPISISGTESMLKKGKLRLYPGTAHVTFHEPLNPADFATREDLMAAVRKAIESGLPEWMWVGTTS